jgi:hypothetical protein
MHKKITSLGIGFIKKPDKKGTHVDHFLHQGLQYSWNTKEKRQEEGVCRVKKISIEDKKVNLHRREEGLINSW